VSAAIPFTLTRSEFLAFWQKPCSYCGSPIETIGLDRIDNTRGYEAGNITSCCQTCNQLKGEDTVQEFLTRCQRITELHPC
jgi:hypothetical protein